MAALGALVVFAAALVWLYGRLRRHLAFRQLIDQLPGPRTMPIIGNVHQLKKNPDEFFEQAVGVCVMYQQRMRMIKLWLFNFAFVLVYGADEAECILANAHNIDKSREYGLLHAWLGRGLLTSRHGGILANAHNIDKSREYGLLHAWLGRSLLTSDARKWRPRRKLLTPTFHYDILKDFVDIYSHHAKVLIGKLTPFALEGRTVDVYKSVTLCALDVICESAMGQHVDAQSNKHPDYVKAIYLINDIIHERQKKPWLWPNIVFRLFGRGREHDWCLRTLHSFTEKVIHERHERIRAAGGAASLVDNNNDSQQQNNSNGGKRRLAFLDLLLEMVEQGQMPIEDVREEVDTFMFEGHDTTSAGMNWLLHLLGTDARAQQLVQQELDDIFGDDHRPPTFADIGRMKYLECCIKESLRLYPSVPLFARGITKPVEIRGKTIPAGTTVIINPFMVHRDPAHWPDPELFRPERFLPENTTGRHPFAYLPFSAGARNCIGQRFALMEEKTIVSWLLRYFNVKSAMRRDQVRPKAELILRPVQGVHLNLSLRRVPPFVSINNNNNISNNNNNNNNNSEKISIIKTYLKANSLA